MPMADGTFVKVYLLGYKFSANESDGARFNNESIARHLNIPLGDVLRAWDFWEKRGIIRKHTREDKTFDVEFLSLRQLYVDNNYSTKKAGEGVPRTAATPAELIEAAKVPAVQQMFAQIDDIMRRRLVPTEHMKVLDWLYAYHLDPDVVVLAFSYAVTKRNVKSLKYVEAILRSWKDQGLLTLDAVNEHLATRQDRFSAYRRVYQSLGYANRTPTEGDREIIDKWLDTFALDLEFILFVLKESSKKTSNVNMNYMDAIMTRLHSEGITTSEGFLNQSKPPSKAPTKEQKQKINNIKNRFHNFQQRSDDYSDDDLEKLLGIKK